MANHMTLKRNPNQMNTFLYMQWAAQLTLHAPHVCFITEFIWFVVILFFIIT